MRAAGSALGVFLVMFFGYFGPVSIKPKTTYGLSLIHIFSADPLKDDLQAKLAGIEFGKPETVTDQLDGILSNASIFGSDLTKTVLADKIKAYFKAEIAGPGAVRKTLHEAVNG